MLHLDNLDASLWDSAHSQPSAPLHLFGATISTCLRLLQGSSAPAMGPACRALAGRRH